MMRHRTGLVEMTSEHIQHMHNADVAGQRDPVELGKWRAPHIKASEETIRKSLRGNRRAEHLFTLEQSRQSCQHYQEQIIACDEKIEKLVMAFVARVDPAEKPLPPGPKVQGGTIFGDATLWAQRDAPTERNGSKQTQTASSTTRPQTRPF